MAPHKNTRVTDVSSSNSNVSFLQGGTEGDNVEHIICTLKYITVQELRKPAVVTDRLHRDYEDLKCYGRISMKGGVRKILTMDEVIQALNAYWGDGTSPNATAAINNDDDSLVSIVRMKKTHN